METFVQDVRYAVRLLARNPLPTGLAALALAVGIGANAALFGAVDAVLLRPFPFHEQDRLVVIWERDVQREQAQVEVAYPNFADWRAEARSFTQMAAMPNAVSQGFAFTTADGPVEVRGSSVSASFFDVLGVRPALGRGFLPEEDTAGASRTVVLGDGVWKRHFGADPAIVGRTVRLNDSSFTVVGITPPAFEHPRGAEMWTPIVPAEPEIVKDRRVGWLQVVARLKPGVSLEQARAEMDSIVTRLALTHEKRADGRGALVTPLVERLLGETRPALMALLGAVALVLLIACANVASLLMVRATARQRETAVRLSLGASRGRIVRQGLTESLVLALLGGVGGVLLAVWGVEALVALAPADLPRLSTIAIDGRVLAFALAVSIATAVLCGLAPALQASRPGLTETLRDGARGSTAGRRSRGLRVALVAFEMALALVVLLGAGLIGRSFQRLQQVDLGFEPRDTVSMRIVPPAWRYPTPADERTLYRNVLERVRALPGVEAAGAVLLRPLELGPIGVNAWFLREGETEAHIERNPAVNYQVVTAGYFRAMGIPLLEGRVIDDRDTEKTPAAVVLGETAARRLFPGGSAVGKRLATAGTPKDAAGGFLWATVVGVVEDVRYRELHDVRLDLYVPYEQAPFGVHHLIVRTPTDPVAMAAAIRREVAALDKDLPITAVLTLDEIVSGALAAARFRTALLAAFAALALLLASVGVYGVMAYTVTERTHEIGVRMALGARAGDVSSLVVAQGMRPALVGIGAGLAAALFLGRLLSSLLFGVTATDPLTFAGAAAVLAAIAFVASYLPARVATRVDPVIALRAD